MSIKNGVWHDAKIDPPGADYVNKHVLIVKENKAGDRSISFGAYMSSIYKPMSKRWEGTWTTSNGKGTVLYWMTLPKIPGEDDTDGK